MVDVVIQGLSNEYDVDTNRIYACGYSNGAVFTWVLVASRPNLFAAFAPVAGIDNGNIESASTPEPVIFHFGEQDKEFKLAWAEKTIRRIKRMNRIEGQGDVWGTGYQWFKPEVGGAPFVLNLHPGGHEVPAYAPENIVAFFKMQSLSL